MLPIVHPIRVAFSRRIPSFSVREVEKLRSRLAALAHRTPGATANRAADRAAMAASVLAVLQEKASDTKARVEVRSYTLSIVLPSLLIITPVY